MRRAGRILDEDKPLAAEERMISLVAVPEAEVADFTTESPGHWLLRSIPWTEAENAVTATNANASIAKVLNLKNGFACLVIERRTWRHDMRITTVTQTFDSSVYQVMAKFKHR